ncbi:crotonyl-CoA carboxylase/reductase [Streptomyces sp. NPDC048717]|uniref:crotonyl-CoA carboxylase/reductase n=1 Tax=Streptomyces sp. NPDC048717 TaxID=3154928 RepID=UPI00341B36E9
MTDVLAEAVVNGAGREELESLPVPKEFTALHTRIEDVDLFRGERDKDVRRSLRLGAVPMPELAPDEVLIAVMASGINYNTVWSATFEPVPTYAFLRQLGKQGGWQARHDQPYHVMGSDAAGVIVRTGSGVRRWDVGDHVVVTTAYVDDQDPLTHQDGMLGSDQRAWGFETNFGGLAHYTVVRANQLLPKPEALTWEEAAANPLCAGTAYRMLVGDRGARIKQGDVVLIWGAAGGLGAYASQFVRNGGGIAVGVVSSEEKAAQARSLGCHAVINRQEIGLAGSEPADPSVVGKSLGRLIRKAVGEDPNVVFEHVGRATFGVSVFVARRGGTVVTCGSSTGYQHEFDNRYLWMRLKKVIGSHGANLQEQSETNRLISQGAIKTALSVTYPMEEAAEAARLVQQNGHIGKVGVLGLAPKPGLGVTDQALRERIGELNIAPLRR